MKNCKKQKRKYKRAKPGTPTPADARFKCKAFDPEHEDRVIRLIDRHERGLKLFDQEDAPPLVSNAGWKNMCIHCGDSVNIFHWKAAIAAGWRKVQYVQSDQCVECVKCAREWDAEFGHAREYTRGKDGT